MKSQKVDLDVRLFDRLIKKERKRSKIAFKALTIDCSILGHDCSAILQRIPEDRPKDLVCYRMKNGRVVEAIFRG